STMKSNGPWPLTRTAITGNEPCGVSRIGAIVFVTDFLGLGEWPARHSRWAWGPRRPGQAPGEPDGGALPESGVVVVVVPVVAGPNVDEQVVGFVGPLLDAVGLGLGFFCRFLGLVGLLPSEVSGLLQGVGAVPDLLLLVLVGPLLG